MLSIGVSSKTLNYSNNNFTDGDEMKLKSIAYWKFKSTRATSNEEFLCGLKTSAFAFFFTVRCMLFQPLHTLYASMEGQMIKHTNCTSASLLDFKTTSNSNNSNTNRVSLSVCKHISFKKRLEHHLTPPWETRCILKILPFQNIISSLLLISYSANDQEHLNQWDPRELSCHVLLISVSTRLKDSLHNHSRMH